jgi:hypothetical protein
MNTNINRYPTKHPFDLWDFNSMYYIIGCGAKAAHGWWWMDGWVDGWPMGDDGWMDGWMAHGSGYYLL